MCVCVFSSHPFWTSSSLDVPAEVKQEEGQTGFSIHLPSAVRTLNFLARRIQWSAEQCVCVFFPFILDIKFVGRTSRGHTGGRSHRRKVTQDLYAVHVLIFLARRIQPFSRCSGLPASSLPVCPVYRCFFFVPPRHPGLPAPGWFIFSCSRSPSCCCTLPHTLLHTTQHNTLGVAGSSQHLPTHHAMCGRRHQSNVF